MLPGIREKKAASFRGAIITKNLGKYLKQVGDTILRSTANRNGYQQALKLNDQPRISSIYNKARDVSTNWVDGARRLSDSSWGLGSQHIGWVNPRAKEVSRLFSRNTIAHEAFHVGPRHAWYRKIPGLYKPVAKAENAIRGNEYLAQAIGGFSAPKNKGLLTRLKGGIGSVSEYNKYLKAQAAMPKTASVQVLPGFNYDV